MRSGLPALCLIAALLGFTACTKRETPVEEGLRTHTLLIGNQNEPATLDPSLMDAATDMNIVIALFEGLTCYDEPTGLPVPGVAERWDISPDGLVYTFHLRPTAKWSNGDRVTAADFAYSFQRILSPALGSTYAYMLWPIKDAEAFNSGKLKNFSEVGVAALDDATLRVTLTRPTPYLLALAAHSTWMPVHRATVEKFGKMDERGTAWTRPGNLVGNGAFTLAEWQPNARLIVAKNPHYWGAAANQIERVIFYPTEKSDVEELNFRAGQLHLTYSLPTSKIPGYRQQSPDRLRLDPLLNLTYINFNVTKPPFTNPKVRRALALALDRTAISERVFNGGWPPAHTLVPPHCGNYTSPAGQPDDFATARALLAEAGFPGGKGFPTLAMQVLNDDKLPKMAEAIQAMWQRELGIKITIEPYEQKTWLQNQQTLSHTLALLGWTADFPDPITFLDTFRTGNGNNWTGWGSKEYDALLDQAAITADPAARFDLLRKAESVILDEPGIAPVVYRASTYLIHPAVKNWQASPLGLHRYQLIRLEQ
ncbi:MAG: peptide ABC transporter substrate-binding protein [Verrucomicrobia bacterium]|nr:peptide ABC transporter substrate-binding protein [Verrucomicrobiota bacterium]